MAATRPGKSERAPVSRLPLIETVTYPIDTRTGPRATILAPMRVLFEATQSENEVVTFVQILRESDSRIAATPMFFGPTDDLNSGIGAFSETGVFLSPESVFAESFSSEAIEIASSFRLSEDFDAARFMVMKLLNRLDLTGTFRFVDREVYFQAAVLAIADFLLSVKPDLIVFRVTPHEFLPYAVSVLANFMNIEVLHFQPCSIAPAMIPKLVSGQQLPISSFTTSTFPVSHGVRLIAQSQLGNLSRGIAPRYMNSQRARDRGQLNSRSRLLAWVRSFMWLWRPRYPESIDFPGHAKRFGLWPNAHRIFLTRSLQATLRRSALSFSKAISASENYSVYAMHYEPERTSLPDGLPVDAQLDAIVRVRAMIDFDEVLVVKEHYSQQSSALRGFLGRSPLFYNVVAALPRTQFASIDADLRTLVSGARSVFTLTGTIALEAALIGVPVFYFGDPWWNGLPGTRRIDFFARSEDFAPPNSVDSDAVEAFILGTVMDRMIPGLASESVATAESRWGPLPEGLVHAQEQAIAQCVLTALYGPQPSSAT